MPAGNFNYDFASVYSYGSPSTNSYNFAWDVRSSGAMDYGHYGSRSDYSYGINSPVMVWDEYVYLVYTSGIVFNDNGSYDISYSYGSLRTHIDLIALGIFSLLAMLIVVLITISLIPTEVKFSGQPLQYSMVGWFEWSV